MASKPRPMPDTRHWDDCWRCHGDCAAEKVEALLRENAILRQMLDLATSVHTLTNEQLIQLRQNCLIAMGKVQ
jgi:hypothetical protein